MKFILSWIVVVLLVGLAWLPCAGQLAWHPEKDFRWAELAVPKDGQPGFTLLPPEQTGITFTNPLDEHAIAADRTLANGSGVAIGDIYHDGRPAIFFCSLNGHNALYKNLGGMKFMNVTAGSGIACSNYVCHGAVFADINGDGWLDLLISTSGHGVLCFTNKGDGTFVECSQYAGTLSRYGATTMALADIDGNGTLDLYVADYRAENSRDRAEFDKIDIINVDGHPTVPPALRDRFVIIDGKIQEYGEPDLLYLNDGKGHFTAMSWTNGAFLDEDGKALTEPPRDWGLTAAFHDLSGGGRRTFTCAMIIGRRTGCGSTTERTFPGGAAPGVAAHERVIDGGGLCGCGPGRTGGFLRGGHAGPRLGLRKREVELFSGLMRNSTGRLDDRAQLSRNMLFHNRGDGTFEEVGEYAGITASGWSWQPVFLDVDLDGYEDILIPTGYFHNVE